MLHSSGLGRKAIMLPHQTRNVFLSWFLLLYITLGILARNLCPPESLESASLNCGTHFVCLSDLARNLSRPRGFWNVKHMFACVFMSVWLHVCPNLHTIICGASSRACVRACVPVCFHVYLFVFFLCVRVPLHIRVQEIFNKGKMFALLSSINCLSTKGFKVSFSDTEGLWVATSKLNTFLPPPF